MGNVEAMAPFQHSCPQGFAFTGTQVSSARSRYPARPGSKEVEMESRFLQLAPGRPAMPNFSYRLRAWAVAKENS